MLQAISWKNMKDEKDVSMRYRPFSTFVLCFARALDGLAPEHRGGMVEHVLKNLRDRCMNLRGGPSDAQEWLRKLLART